MILKLGLVKILSFKFYCLVEIFSWRLVEILKMKCDQDLCLNFWYDLKKLLWQDELNPRVRCAFGNVLNLPEPATNITAGDVTSLHKDFFGIVDPVRGSDHQFVSSFPAWHITQHLGE